MDSASVYPTLMLESKTFWSLEADSLHDFKYYFVIKNPKELKDMSMEPLKEQIEKEKKIK